MGTTSEGNFIERIRKTKTSIASFRNLCHLKGYSENLTFELFVNGMDWNENPVEQVDYLERGSDLAVVLEAWLAMW